jgi:hypothetical protein
MTTTHRAVPLDGNEDTWRCVGCGTQFISRTGFAVCPAATPPGCVDGTVTNPDELRRRILTLAQTLVSGAGLLPGDLARHVLTLDAFLSRGGPLPTAWAAAMPEERPVETIRPGAEWNAE